MSQNEFFKLFLPADKPLLTRTYKVCKEDHELIAEVYPESGFLTYYPGLTMRMLADEIRHQKLSNYFERIKSPHANVTSLIPNYDKYAEKHIKMNIDNNDQNLQESSELSDRPSEASSPKISEAGHRPVEATHSSSEAGYNSPT